MTMKTTSLVATLAMLLTLTAGADDNPIDNPGFERGPGMLEAPGWTPDGRHGFATGGGEKHTGQNAYKTWKQESLFQQFKTEAGQRWTCRAWFMNGKAIGVDTPLSGDAIGRIRIEFKDLALNTIRAFHSGVINSETEPGKWVELQAGGTAPQGTAYVRVILNRIAIHGDGTLWVDDVEVTRGSPEE